jgi:hypothetical protein
MARKINKTNDPRSIGVKDLEDKFLSAIEDYDFCIKACGAAGCTDHRLGQIVDWRKALKV